MINTIFLWILFKQCKLHLGYICSIKKVNKNKVKYKAKPWVTPALQKSISIKNNFLKKKIITAKDPQVKETYKEYQDYRNLLSTVLKWSKTNYSQTCSNDHLYKTTTCLRWPMLSSPDLVCGCFIKSVLWDDHLPKKTTFKWSQEWLSYKGLTLLQSLFGIQLEQHQKYRKRLKIYFNY